MIYDRPISALMRDAVADLSPPYTVSEIVAWFAEHYPKVKASSVRAHVKGLTANDPSRHHYHVGGMPVLFMRRPDKTLIPFDPSAEPDIDDDETLDVEFDGDGGDATLAQTAEFVLEAHLEDFLAGNWKSINWGRPLEIWRGPDGESGHQLATSVGRLDFLCLDPGTDALVVLELKRGRPSDKVVGQVARYIGYVSSRLAGPGQAVEGLIIAHESDDALRYAVSALPALALMTYEVSFELKRVESPKARGL
jgi:endonuclease